MSDSTRYEPHYSPGRARPKLSRSDTEASTQASQLTERRERHRLRIKRIHLAGRSRLRKVRAPLHATSRMLASVARPPCTLRPASRARAAARRQPGFAHGGPSDVALDGARRTRSINEQSGPSRKRNARGDRIRLRATTVARGAYERERDDGTIVHGDASGEWTLDEEGEVAGIVFFTSPLRVRRSRKT
jgi:hypothetical protein